MKQDQFTDVITTESLRQSLGALAKRFVPYAFLSIDSTNAEAKRRALDGEDYALIAAEGQTAGRGRMGRNFYSPDCAGVYFSILYRLDEPLSDAVAITSGAAVAVMRAVRQICGRQLEIKWVNDLYLDGKKVAGILAESVTVDGSTSVIIGIGINLLESVFPDELADIAGAIGVNNIDRSKLIAAVLEELLPFLQEPSDRSWLSDYRAYSCVIGKPITWFDQSRTDEGIAIDIDNDGALLVKRQDNTTARLSTGEISVRVKG